MHLNLNKNYFKFSKRTCVIIIFQYEKYLILLSITQLSLSYVLTHIMA